MKVLESPVGQNAKEFSEVLNRNMFADGKVMLNALHTGGYIKKVQTSQVIVTPNTTSSVRLDELNDILNKMAQGEEATEKLRTMDQSRGLRDPAKHTKPVKETKAQSLTAADINSVLSEDSIAVDLENQAARMEAEAKGLLAEAKRLKDEAKALKPAKTTRVSHGKKQKVAQA
jgi:regulatory protein YycH of two-component signal transduction system YycFG